MGLRAQSSLKTSLADSYSKPGVPRRFEISEMIHQSGMDSP